MPLDFTDEMRIHFIDVGQGAATLVEFPCGAMLVDTGGEEDEDGRFHSTEALSAYLTAFFARRTDLNGTLDLLLLTHPHIDHIRGGETVLKTWKVKNFVENGQTPFLDIGVEAMRRIHDALSASPDTAQFVVRTDEFPDGGGPLTNPTIDPFSECKGVNPSVETLWGQVRHDPGWGEDDYGKTRFTNENNHSVATRVDFGKSSLLITGDLEVESIRSMMEIRDPKLLNVDIYEVGHHGSANGTTRELMEAMSPAWAVMEMGPSDRRAAWTAWQYGHPRISAIELLEAGVSAPREPVEMRVGTAVKNFADVHIDKAIYGTGWDGTVVLEAKADGTISRGAPDVAAGAE